MTYSHGPARTDFADRAESPVVGRIEPAPEIFDALTDLFLGEVDAPDASRATEHQHTDDHDDRMPQIQSDHDDVTSTMAAVEPVVEALVLGHLPVLGSAWASQYVRHVAEDEGRPVGYVRIHGGYATVELVSPPDELPPPSVERTASLQQAMETAGELTARWIIRADDGEGDDAHFAFEPNQITLLTSADEAAVVGAYRLLKRLGQASPDELRPTYRLAVLDNNEEHAVAVASRLADAARAFLDMDLDRAVCNGRINAAHPATLLFSGPSSDTLETIRHAIEMSPPPLVEPLAPAIHTPTTASANAAPVPTDPPAPDQAEVFADVMHAIGQSEPHPPAVSLSDPTDPPPAAAPPTPHDAPPHGTQETVSLAAHAGGLVALPLQCPYALEVELAMDADGRGHLLVRSESDREIERSVVALTRSAAWFRDHARMIRGMMPAAGNLSDQPPQQHIFVCEPKLVRPLLDGDIRLHLLAHVRTPVYHVELN